MYQVFCNSKAHRKYQPYSQEYKTIEEAKILLYEIAHIRKELLTNEQSNNNI